MLASKLWTTCFLGLVVALDMPHNVAATVRGTTAATTDNILCDAREVLIVGAGFAGLAAAKELKDNNFTDFLIIESTNRVGGRVSSVQPKNFDGLWVEEGANWIYNFKGNPIWALMRQHNKSFTYQNFDDFKMFQYDGRDKVCQDFLV